MIRGCLSAKINLTRRLFQKDVMYSKKNQNKKIYNTNKKEMTKSIEMAEKGEHIKTLSFSQQSGSSPISIHRRSDPAPPARSPSGLSAHGPSSRRRPGPPCGRPQPEHDSSLIIMRPSFLILIIKINKERSEKFFCMPHRMQAQPLQFDSCFFIVVYC